MLYLIYAEDVPGSLEQRLAARPAHLARLQSLKDEDRLIVAGPNPIADSEDPGTTGFSGSVIIAEFATLEEAKAWADKDPYVDAGVYQKVTVKPFKRVF
ncbi:YciI family protein [Budviciaceae bacterium CWB-B4]|uniref:YciI family protein n=1 Tax=Limnobaculum xujianqingii TaxID=2738837 RepID=A0A9D7FUW0_9GAMM|nr:YciI family protein [Limnobaculum xujianqingii]MBK5073743.1 YciI family protein [Limnobaculum xujianqingii]MBK5177363.1 YciI family protein [Limnobaculum xujianqingii]